MLLRCGLGARMLITLFVCVCVCGCVCVLCVLCVCVCVYCDVQASLYRSSFEKSLLQIFESFGDKLRSGDVGRITAGA
jgi:hypothetical protein